MYAKRPRGTSVPPIIETSGPEPEAVAIPAASRVLGISRTKLYELIGNGALPSVKIGRRRLVRPAAIRALLADLEARDQPHARRKPAHG
jgi:excisionase family DNA binding protein